MQIPSYLWSPLDQGFHICHIICQDYVPSENMGRSRDTRDLGT
jgi:hypothetical protein